MSESRTVTEEWKWRRREIIIRDDYTCQECGVRGGPKGNADLEVHHITPASKGGSDEPANLETLCMECHRSERENPGWYDEEYSDDEFLVALRELGGAAGTSDIADAVGCPRRTAYNRLNNLRDEGELNTQEVGSSLLWMLVDDE